MPQFRIPGPLRTLSGGVAVVTVEAQDLRSAIDALDAEHPGFKGRLLDDTGQPRQFVNLFLNDEDVRLGKGLDSPLSDKDEIAIVPAVAGGLHPGQPRTGHRRGDRA
jgi:molybdopterin converting factor small subunit